MEGSVDGATGPYERDEEMTLPEEDEDMMEEPRKFPLRTPKEALDYWRNSLERVITNE